MRSLLQAALTAALAAGLALGAASSLAQDAAPAASPPPSASTLTASQPPAPIPYSALNRAAKPTPAKRVAAKPATAPTPSAPPPVAVRPGARLTPDTPIPPAELEAFVDGAVRQAMASDHIAGLTVSVVQDGQVVLKKGYGVSRLSPARPVDPDTTLFRLGSITKTFTWIAVMKEAEAGRIRLGAPVNLYLPQPLQVKDDGYKQPVLVRDLMTHSAGFEDRAFGQLIERDPRQVRPMDVYLRQERPRRVRAPGQLPSYSNYGAALAGAALAYVSTQPYQSLIEREVTGPLGMAHTTLREPYPARSDLPPPMPSALADAVSDGFRWTGAGYQARPFEYISQVAPAGSASSTAADMARYMLMQLNGGSLDGATVYGPTTAAAFRTPMLAGAPGVPSWDAGFLEVPLAGGFKGYGHDGATLSFRTDMLTVPDLRLGVFAAANTESATAFVDRLPGLIVAHFYAPPAEQPRPGDPQLAERAKAYAGQYLTTRRAYRGLEGFIDRLTGVVRVSVTRDGYLLTATGNGAGRWAPTSDPARFQAADGPLALVFALKDGRARRLFASSGAEAADRIGPLFRPGVLALTAALTALASVAALVGLFTRDRREFRQTPVQDRGGLMQTGASVLWLLAIGGFALWGADARDQATLVYGWPGPFLMIASACALVASVLNLFTLVILPAIWRGGRRVDSWTDWRKLRFTATVLVFTAFSVLLGLWGALEPWSG